VDGMTMAYLVVGGLSVVILLLAVVVGDVAHLALHADSDGPFSLPAIAAFFGGGGFGAQLPRPCCRCRCPPRRDC